jgi:hypothetical protein
MSNELDKHIGETLGRYESSVDAEALWQAVKPPKKRKPWLWLLLLAGAVVVAGGLWSWSTNNEEGRMVESSLPIVDNTALSGEKEVTVSVPEAEDKIAVPAAEETTVDRVGETGRGSVVETENATPFFPEVRKEVNSEANRIGTKEKITADNISIDNTERKGVNIEDPILAVAEKGSVIIPLNEEEENTTLLPSIQGKPLEVVTTKERSTTSTPLVEKLNFGVKSTGSENEVMEITPVATTYRRSNKSSFFAQIDVAYFGLQRELENKDSLAWDWVSDRTNTEELLEGLSADLSLGYRSEGGWQIRGGLGYTQINTLFGNTVTTQTIDSVNGLTMLIYHPDNSVDSIFGAVAYYETTNRQKQTYNSIRQWELPLLAGYNFELGRLTLLTEAGVRLRLNRSWEGTVSNRDLENGFQDLAAVDWYRTELGLSLQGGIQLAYPITSQLDILAGGSIRYNLKDFSSDASPFVERYQLLGGQLSLRYRF